MYFVNDANVILSVAEISLKLSMTIELFELEIFILP